MLLLEIMRHPRAEGDDGGRERQYAIGSVFEREMEFVLVHVCE